MAEVTHEQILLRVSAVEKDVSALKESVAVATQRADDNHDSIKDLYASQQETLLSLTEHRTEVKTGIRVLMALLGLGMGVIGILVSVK